MGVINLLIALFTLLSKIIDLLTYHEGLQKAKQTPEFQYNDNFQKVDAAIANHDGASLAAITEQLRPDQSNPDTGLKSPGPSTP